MSRRLGVWMLAGTGLVVLALAGLLAAAYVVFGNIAAYRDRVESFLGAATGGIVQIGELSSSWTGIVPELRAIGVRLRDPEDRNTVLRLGEMRLRPKLLPLLRGSFEFHRIVLDRPAVELVRNEDGRITLGELQGGGGGSPLSGLLAQQQVVVNGGTLIWRDRRDPGPPLTVRDINFTLRDEGGVRRVSGSARPPEALSRPLSVEGGLSGTPKDGDLDGTLRVDTGAVVLANLPMALAELLPVSVSGTLDLQLTLSWREGSLVGATSQAQIAGPEVQLPGGERPLRADRLSGTLELVRAGDGWTLRAWRPEWVRGAERFAPEEVTVERSGAETNVSFRDVDLDGLADLLLSLATSEQRSGPLGRLHPRGHVLVGMVRFDEDWRSAGPLALQLRFQDLSFDAQERFPGVAGLDGELDYRRPQGRARIESERLTVIVPTTNPLRIAVDRLDGDVNVQRTESGWMLRGENFGARNADAALHSGRFELIWPFDPAAAPVLSAAAELGHFELPAVKNYVPAVAKTEKFHKWYARALHSGRAVAGHIETEGRLDRFPYARGGGRIDGWARIENAELDFEPGFPVVHAKSVEMGLKDSELSFRSTDSQLDRSPVKEALVRLPAIFDPGQRLLVDGAADVTVSDGLTFLQQGPLFKDEDEREVLNMWKADGKGELNLKLDVPLKQPKESRVEGNYTFSAPAALFMDQLELKDVKAKVQFTDRSASAEAKVANFLGGPAALKLRTVEPGRPPKLVFDLSGTAAPAMLANAFAPGLAGSVTGSAPWTGRIETTKGSWKGSVASNLGGVALNLPEPLRKAAGASVPLAVEYAVRQSMSGQLSLRYGDRSTAVLALNKVEGAWRLSGGEISVGERKAAAAGGRGLKLRVRQPTLDLDAWLALANAVFPERGEQQPSPEISVRARTRKLRYLRREWGEVSLSADSPDGVRWNATLNGDLVSGSAQVSLARGDPHYRLTFARLQIPIFEGDEPPVAEKPSGMPRVEVAADDFRYASRSYGKLELRAQPGESGWQIEQLTLKQPALALSARGAWSGDGAGESHIEITAESQNFGAALKALAIEQRLEGGEGKISAQLRWPGPFHAFAKGTVEGTIEIDARRGRFQAMETGVGRLFGLLNLDALARRLRLDFSDVFGKGTPFDQFGGKAQLSGGDLRSDGIIIVGPSLYVEATGRIGLVSEDFDLDLIVAPPLAGNLSLIGAVINPLYGAVMYLTQKVFQKQLARLVYYHYRVVGPWNEPAITRVKHEPEPTAPQ